MWEDTLVAAQARRVVDNCVFLSLNICGFVLCVVVWLVTFDKLVIYLSYCCPYQKERKKKDVLGSCHFSSLLVGPTNIDHTTLLSMMTASSLLSLQRCFFGVISSIPKTSRHSNLYTKNSIQSVVSLCRERNFTSSTETSSVGSRFKNILIEARSDRVGLVTLNRPKQLNAINEETQQEVLQALEEFDRDRSIGAIVLTGSERAFAAGADIKEMANRNFVQARKVEQGGWIDRVYAIKKPIIAAVNGYALGGGCELAMACDIVLAGQSAFFGQPEVQIGTIPGWGGTQRLIRAVGKAKAMEMILTGRRMSAEEAESAGLVARVLPPETLLQEAIEVAKTIASYSDTVVAMAKECVNIADNVPLNQGLAYERRMFHSTFSLNDQKEGMKAFIDKRPAKWSYD